MKNGMAVFFTKNALWLGIAAVVVVGGGAYWYVSSSAAPSFATVAVSRGNVVQSVDESAAVEAENNVDLSFTSGGQIAAVAVSEGQAVAAGQALVSLDQSALQAGLEQANAGVAAAQAKLDELMNGTRPEQLQIDQTAVTNAQASLSAAIGSAYTAADDAIHNQTDNFYTNPRSTNPLFLVTVSDSQTLINIVSQRVALEGTLTNWYNALSAGSTNPSSLAAIANNALASVQTYLDAVALAVNNAQPNGQVTATVLAGYKANIVVARTEVVAAVNALTSAESAFTSAQNALTLAQAGSTPQDIEAQKAVVLQAQASAAAAQVALNHASIIAPFSGTVRNLTAKVGLIASPGVPVVSLTNDEGLKVTAYVSQSDVAKLSTGDKANVTLDAYGTGTTFPAAVTTIDSAPTQVNGTAAYKVTLHFASPNSTIRDGMTGNVHIIVAEHDNVLEVPSRLVVSDGTNNFILVAHGGTTVRQQVQTGLTGDDGMTEITSGLSEGDTITNF